jgi:Domain of unknown function (DUF5134)
VTGPAWLAGVLAALMILIAAGCAGRLAISHLRRRDTELDADGLHVLMGVAMAGMLEPRLGPLPGTAWQAVFAAAAAWFAWQAIRGRRRPAGLRCAHPAPHAVECAAMVYMLVPAGSLPSGHGSGMAMPGMSGPAATAANPALALVLALFMLGYMVWTTDRLASLSRARAAATARGAAGGRQSPASPAPAAAKTAGTPSPAATAHAGLAGSTALAPRLAACHKIAMSLAMGYMLVMMI